MESAAEQKTSTVRKVGSMADLAEKIAKATQTEIAKQALAKDEGVDPDLIEGA